MAPSSPSAPAPANTGSSGGGERTITISTAVLRSITTRTLQNVGARPADVVQSATGRRLTAEVRFVELAGEHKPFTEGQVRCRAEVEGKRLRVLANTFRGNKAHCAWRIPKGLSGKALVGVVAVQVGQAALPRLFIRPVK